MKNFKYFAPPKSVKDSIQKLKTKIPEYWEINGEKTAVKLANYALKNVPAYKKFINDKNIKLTRIRNINDLKKLPLIDKKEYLIKYPFKDLFPKNGIDLVTTISSTSGSTGEPFYFPRGEEQDRQYEYVAEVFLTNQFEIDKNRTLGIIGFGLGIWIGGIFTYKNLNKISQKGYRLALAPVGTNKEIFLKSFVKMADLFDQVILMGYPPFIKSVIDEGINRKIDWKKYNLKIFVATEGFSEKFRDYLIRKTGIKNPYKNILNVYGSVELGTMSHETPITNLIRKIAVSNKKIFKNIFPGATLTPTLVQYYPHLVYFEDLEGEIVATGYGSSFPLIRYRLHDRGGVVPFEEMINKLKAAGVDIIKEAKNAKIEDTILKLPFVYVFERTDFVVILRGANIYPENIKNALFLKDLEDLVTGRFTMIKRENKNLNEYLEINIELKKEINKTTELKNKIHKRILDSLCKDNSEFNYLYNTEGAEIAPTIILYNNEDQKYFRSDVIKQKWVKNN